MAGDWKSRAKVVAPPDGGGTDDSTRPADWQPQDDEDVKVEPEIASVGVAPVPPPDVPVAGWRARAKAVPIPAPGKSDVAVPPKALGYTPTEGEGRPETAEEKALREAPHYGVDDPNKHLPELRAEYVEKYGPRGLGTAPAGVESVAQGMFGQHGAARLAGTAPGTSTEQEELKQTINAGEHPVVTGLGRTAGSFAGFLRGGSGSLGQKMLQGGLVGGLPGAVSGDPKQAVEGALAGGALVGLGGVKPGTAREWAPGMGEWLKRVLAPKAAWVANRLPAAAAVGFGGHQALTAKNDADLTQGLATAASPFLLGALTHVGQRGGAREIEPQRVQAERDLAKVQRTRAETEAPRDLDKALADTARAKGEAVGDEPTPEASAYGELGQIHGKAGTRLSHELDAIDRGTLPDDPETRAQYEYVVKALRRNDPRELAKLTEIMKETPEKWLARRAEEIRAERAQTAKAKIAPKADLPRAQLEQLVSEYAKTGTDQALAEAPENVRAKMTRAGVSPSKSVKSQYEAEHPTIVSSPLAKITNLFPTARGRRVGADVQQSIEPSHRDVLTSLTRTGTHPAEATHILRDVEAARGEVDARREGARRADAGAAASAAISDGAAAWLKQEEEKRKKRGTR